MTPRRLAATALPMLALLLAAGAATATEAVLAELRGKDFQGGANSRFGSTFFGRDEVNYVYAQPTGPHATMRATFRLERVPAEPQFLYVTARDDDAGGACAVAWTLNGATLHEGPSGFSKDAWQIRCFAIPQGVLKAGANELAVANREKTGQLGMPPWFMVAQCVVADGGYEPPLPAAKRFTVELPAQVRPLPEPLPPGQTEPGFKIRGTKGWNWTPQQYLEEIPVLAKYKMNFLMNCYLSMYSHHPAGQNEWWQPLSEERKRAYERVVRACQEHGIAFCFAIHPQLSSPRPLDPTNEADFEKLWPHFAWAQGLGVKWFCISLDDISGVRIDGTEQARLVNKLFKRLRQNDPAAQFVQCPTYYWGDATPPYQRQYLEALGRELHPDVYLFWTGPQVVSLRVTRSAAESYKSVVKHRLILWDNYPVNDNTPTMHLGPLTGRDPDLCEVVAGYMSNPLCTQNQANRLPLLTCADYAYNPKAYDPARSIGQAILHLAETEEARLALKDLVEAYPGMLLCGAGGTGFNPVRYQTSAWASFPGSRPRVETYLRRLEELSARLDRAFPNQFGPAKKTLSDDIAWMKRALAGKP